jgi:hypothetical protein
MLHADTNGVVASLDLLLGVTPLKAEVLEQLDGGLGVCRQDEWIEGCDLHGVFSS